MITRTIHSTLLLGVLMAGACGDDLGDDESSDAGRDSAVDATVEGRDAGRTVTPDGGGMNSGEDAGVAPGEDGGFTLECTRGAKVSRVHVEFRCGEITVYTCKDLSNVVIEFEDGSRQRIMGVNGYVNTFSFAGGTRGKRIVRVWVKAGNNSSGEGPGYGERVEAPPQTCPPSGGGGAGGSGSGGTGGTGGGCASGPDVSCEPIPTSGTGGGGGAGGAGGAAGDVAGPG